MSNGNVKNLKRWLMRRMHPHMSCKESARLLSKSQETSLTIGERLAMYLHMSVCVSCFYYKQQIVNIRKALKIRKAKNDAVVIPSETLSEESMARLNKVIADQKDSD